MKILITGKNGQLGTSLKLTAPDHHEYYFVDIEDYDITSTEFIHYIRELSPDILINTAAYTLVDKAETEKDLAYKINAAALNNMVLAAREIQSRFIHISTDFVFSGNAPMPYLPSDTVNPINQYGLSKAQGERIALDAYAENSVIIRTSWLYSSYGNNFVKTMLQLMKEREVIKVVADQTGSPSWAHNLADVIWSFADKPELAGIYHWSDSGIASWYDFAYAIMAEGIDTGILERPVQIIPISTYDYPTPAKRPAYSVLDKTATWKILGHRGVHWRVSLRSMLEEWITLQ